LSPSAIVVVAFGKTNFLIKIGIWICRLVLTILLLLLSVGLLWFRSPRSLSIGYFFIIPISSCSRNFISVCIFIYCRFRCLWNRILPWSFCKFLIFLIRGSPSWVLRRSICGLRPIWSKLLCWWRRIPTSKSCIWSITRSSFLSSFWLIF